MIIKTEKIGHLSVWTEQDLQGKVTATVYAEFRPAVRFDPANLNERRLAAVQLVELGYCKNRLAGKICGFHRNTVGKLLRTKRLLGLDAIFEDNRGPKAPWKYVDSIREQIKKWIEEQPDWTDQQVADVVEKEFAMPVSRSAVARISTLLSNWHTWPIKRNPSSDSTPTPGDESIIQDPHRRALSNRQILACHPNIQHQATSDAPNTKQRATKHLSKTASIKHLTSPLLGQLSSVTNQ